MSVVASPKGPRTGRLFGGTLVKTCPRTPYEFVTNFVHLRLFHFTTGDHHTLHKFHSAINPFLGDEVGS